jgi:hypothetical protein
MSSSKPRVVLRKDAGDPHVTIIIGKMQGGSYTLELHTKSGEPRMWKGLSDDDLADTHSLGSVDGLNDALVSWHIEMSASSESPGQLFMATVLITQDGKPVQHGAYQYPVPNLFDVVRLAVS